MAQRKAMSGREKGKEKKIEIYIYKKGKKKSLQMARPGRDQECLGVLAWWKKGPESSSALCKGEVGRGVLRIIVEVGKKKTLLKHSGFFCSLAGASHRLAPATSIPRAQGDPLPQPMTVLALGAAGTVCLRGCFCSLSQERHR